MARLRGLPRPVPRQLGGMGASSAGPTFVVVGGMHGNEPGGVAASLSVLETLERTRPPLRGRVIFLIGNRPAIVAGKRFLSRDLNRRWYPGPLAALSDGAGARDEDKEQQDLMRFFVELETSCRGPIILLDLHSTSGDSPPFAVLADAPHNRNLAFSLGAPVIIGLEEATDGTMLGWLADRGHTGVAFEGGQHEDPLTAARLEAAIWVGLDTMGILTSPDLAMHRQRLVDGGAGKPGAVEIVYRHGITAGDGFVMEPGWSSFDPVRKGELLARDKDGPIVAPTDGRMLLPLYNAQGEDGFFISKDVDRRSLRLDRWARMASLHRVLPLLPGVRREGRDLVIQDAGVESRVRRAAARLGYRKLVDASGETIRLSRRSQRQRRR